MVHRVTSRDCAWITLEIYRTRVLAKEVKLGTVVLARSIMGLKVAAAGCVGGGLSATGIESCSVCNPMMFHYLQNPIESKNPLQDVTIQHGVLSVAREAFAAPAATF